MNWFKKYRVVQACGGYIPQVKKHGNWYGIDEDLNIFLYPDTQKKYTVQESEPIAYVILNSYRAITQ